MENPTTPAYDNKIYQKYSKKMIVNKEKNKQAFCEAFNLPYKKEGAMMAITYPLTEKNGLERIMEIMDGLMEQGIQVVVIGMGTEKYRNHFTRLIEKHPDNILIIENDDENRRKTYAAADMIPVAAETPECATETRQAMLYGVIPVSLPQEHLENYNAQEESGNAFLYTGKSFWSFFAAFIRASENHKFPYDWNRIRVSAMETAERE